MAAALIMWSRASGSSPCAKRDPVVAWLKGEHGETRQGMGLQRDGTVVEIVASGVRSWTILVSRPDGTNCLVAAGEGWDGPFAAEERGDAL